MRIQVNLPPSNVATSSSHSVPSPTSAIRSLAPAPLTALTPHGELILIELQGSLEIDNPNPSGKQVLGTLTFDPLRPEKPVLMISHHRLEGKFVSLVRPLAVLEKKVRDDENETRRQGVLMDVVNEGKRPMELERAGTVKRAKRVEQELGSSPPRKPTRDSLDFSSSPPQQSPVRSHPSRESELERVDEIAGGEEDEAQTAVYYDVVSVIRRKILFSKRPEPIVKLDTSPTTVRTLKT